MLDFAGLAARADALASELSRRRNAGSKSRARSPPSRSCCCWTKCLPGLTPIEARSGVELVRRVRETGVTVLMVEHVMEIVMPLVDRAVVLDLGRVLVEGKPTEIVRDPKVIGAYLGDRHAVECKR